MNKIKLLLIAPSFYPVHGGAGLRFYRYLPYFHKCNIDTTVICGTPKEKKFTDEDRKADWLQYQDGALITDDIIEHARILKYKIAGSGAKKRSAVLLDKAIQLCTSKTLRPDIIHIIAPMPYEVTDQLTKIKKLGVKLIYSHTIAKDFSNNFLFRLMQRWTVRQVLIKYDHIIVQSTALRNTIKNLASETIISVIPNGVDKEKFSPVKDQQEKNHLRNSLGLPVDAIIITLVGAVHPRKGTDLLIEAWSRLVDQYPKLTLVLIGPRYDQTREELLEFKQKIESDINQSGRESNIYFPGEVKQVDMYLKASDMFVFPSVREGMPNAVLEAMATGLPIVLTKFIGLSSELGEENKHYLLADRKGDVIAEKISEILRDSELSKTLAENSRRWVVSEMSMEKSISAHCECYIKCLAN